VKVTRFTQKLGWLAGLAAFAGPAIIPTTGTSGSGGLAAQQPQAPAVSPQQQYEALLMQARAALRAGDLAAAEHLVAAAENVPYRPQGLVAGLSDTSEKLRQDIAAMKQAPAAPAQNQPFPAFPGGNGQVVPAGGQMPIAAPGVQQGVFNPQMDRSAPQLASAQGDVGGQQASGEALYEQGLQALTMGNREVALQKFAEAWKQEGQMDPLVRQQLREKLMLLNAPANRPADQLPAAGAGTPVTDEQAAMRQKAFREVSGEMAEAERNRESDPLGSLQRLNSLRMRMAQADLDAVARKQYLTIIDRAIGAQQAYIDQNRSNIELDQNNRRILAELDLEREKRAKLDSEIATLVEQFNDLMEQRRYEEAEQIAKQVRELDPNSQIAVSLYQLSRISRRVRENSDIATRKEDGFADSMISVEEASTPFDDRNPLVFPKAETWDQIKKLRSGQQDNIVKMTEMERSIYNKLNTQVTVQFTNKPLAEAMEVLSQMVGIPIHIDPLGLSAEALPSDQTVTLNLNSPISLKSALTLLLEPLNLGQTVRNDVLLITSRDRIRRNVAFKTYNVKDLVIPIPNFITDYNQGMAGAIQSAYQTQGNRMLVQTNEVSPFQMVSSRNNATGPNGNVLAQMAGMPGLGLPMGGGPMVGGMGPQMGMGNPMMGGFGPSLPVPGAGSGGLGAGGGASMADFSQLMNLIQQTVDPDLWESGDATMQAYPGNLSLVISAPQETHEEIQALLEALRALQNVQVTIEVRFITLGDNFFERIGVDFDFRIDDNVTSLPNEDQGPSVTVGLNRDGTPTADLDLAFSQGSFASAIPQVGGFDQNTAAQFGFAILSDIEMFFFLEAAQGDTRTNVLQAPKVTLYDGQFATISDQTQRPFVVGLVPVVGDFAVAQQPIIVVLNEGTQLNVQAVVSPDKQFVRLTLLPNFSRIGEVRTFTFEGRTTSNTGSVVRDADGNIIDREDEEEVTEGTTVQQPELAFTSVTTSVNVPDGGTILLGGIKRLRENRIERGVPMLSKIPYINRLFKNVGIGRETNTFMMTVTPRILIREEEEERQAGVQP
jgi:general secretion pathway protein D